MHIKVIHAMYIFSPVDRATNDCQVFWHYSSNTQLQILQTYSQLQIQFLVKPYWKYKSFKNNKFVSCNAFNHLESLSSYSIQQFSLNQQHTALTTYICYYDYISKDFFCGKANFFKTKYFILSNNCFLIFVYHIVSVVLFYYFSQWNKCKITMQ